MIKRGEQGPYGKRLTKVLLARIAHAVSIGVPLEDAAEYAGIPRSTFFDWLAKGRSDKSHSLYRQLADAVDQGRAQFKVNALERIQKAGETEWTADAWLLERTDPANFGRRTRVDGNVTVQAVPFVDMSKLTIEQQHQFVYLLELAQPNREELTEGQRPALELLPGTGDAT